MQMPRECGWDVEKTQCSRAVLHHEKHCNPDCYMVSRRKRKRRQQNKVKLWGRSKGERRVIIWHTIAQSTILDLCPTEQITYRVCGKFHFKIRRRKTYRIKFTHLSRSELSYCQYTVVILYVWSSQNQCPHNSPRKISLGPQTSTSFT